MEQKREISEKDWMIREAERKQSVNKPAEADYIARWLCSIPGLTDKAKFKMLEECGSLQELFERKPEQFIKVLTVKQLEAYETARAGKRSLTDLQWDYERMVENQIAFTWYHREDFPEKLVPIPDPPFGLYYRGRLPQKDLSVAVIGARDCSGYGRYVAEELGALLGKNGIQVISGMARGIDGISQGAAMVNGGISFGVLGNGVDICYPAANQRLYDTLKQRGGLLSAYPIGTPPQPYLFPPRNRIVSGLSDAVVVIEARLKSGTLITVDMALEQGKEVFAVPGRVTDRLSDGCNKLIADGAGVFLSPEDFLEQLLNGSRNRNENGSQNKNGSQSSLRGRDGSGSQSNTQSSLRSRHGSEIRGGIELSEELFAVYKALDVNPLPTGSILERMGAKIPVGQLNVLLMRLCMMGLAAQLLPGFFARKISDV